jgi:hypothetical protein
MQSPPKAVLKEPLTPHPSSLIPHPSLIVLLHSLTLRGEISRYSYGLALVGKYFGDRIIDIGSS